MSEMNELAVCVWESAVDGLLADAAAARRRGNEGLASKAESEATRLYLSRCGEFEGFRADPLPAALESATGSLGVSEYSARAARGVRSAAYPPMAEYRRPRGPYLAAVSSQAIVGPTAKQIAARAGFVARMAAARLAKSA